MGAYNCDTLRNDQLTFKQMELLFQKTINQKEIPIKNKNSSIQYNILEEYNYLKSKSRFNKEIFQASKKCRNISGFIPLIKEKEIFIKWIKIIYGLENINEFKKQKRHKIPNDVIFKQNLENQFMMNRKEFLKLVALGLPHNLRQIIWTIIIDKDEKDIQNVSDNEKETKHLQTLISIRRNSKDIQQIQKDVNRTFISEKDKTENNLLLLNQLLIALNNLNENIGYCQGINFIVGFILKVTNFNQIKAFHLSRLILKKIKGYFTKDFPLLNKYLKIFNEGFKILFPKLYYHFKDNDLVDEIWIGKWIQALFTINLPFKETCYIWDSLFAYGMDFIIYISLSILGFNQNNLLKLNDSSDILSYLQEALNPSLQTTANKLYRKEVNINDFVISISDVISNAKKIKRHLNEGFFGGIDSKMQMKQMSSNKSIFNYETKMERIKAQNNEDNRATYKRNQSIPSQSSTDDASSVNYKKNIFDVNNKNIISQKNDKIIPDNNNNKNNNIVRKRTNKFFTIYHKTKKVTPNKEKNKSIENNHLSGRYFSSNNNKYTNTNMNLVNTKSNYNSPSINKADISLLLYDNYNDYINNNDSFKKRISLFQRFNKNCETYNSNIYKEYSNKSNMSEGKISNTSNISHQLPQPVNLNNIYSQQFNNILCNNNFLRNCNGYSPYLVGNTYDTMCQTLNPYRRISLNIYDNSKTIDYSFSPNPNFSLYYRKNMSNTPEVSKIRLKEKIDNQTYTNNINCFDTDIMSIGVNEFCEGEKFRNTIPQFNNIKIIN
jgi:hypothetical protein